MNWEQWILIIVFVIGVLSAVALIGRDRKPYTSGQAVVQIILASLLIYLVVRL